MKTLKTKYYETKLSADDDSRNPALALQPLSSAILAAIVRGEIDAVELAKKELSNRGSDEHGNWVGWVKA